MSSVLQKYLPFAMYFRSRKSTNWENKSLYQYQILLKLPHGKKYNEYKENVLKSIEEFYEITAYKSIKLEAFVDV